MVCTEVLERVQCQACLGSKGRISKCLLILFTSPTTIMDTPKLPAMYLCQKAVGNREGAEKFCPVPRLDFIHRNPKARLLRQKSSEPRCGLKQAALSVAMDSDSPPSIVLRPWFILGKLRMMT